MTEVCSICDIAGCRHIRERNQKQDAVRDELAKAVQASIDKAMDQLGPGVHTSDDVDGGMSQVSISFAAAVQLLLMANGRGDA